MTIAFVSWTCTATQSYHPDHPPKGAKRAYNALITGRDLKNTFARDFVSKSFVVDRTTVPALLESRDVDKKGRADDTFLLLLPSIGEQCTRQVLTKNQALWVATQLHLGRKLEDCWDPVKGAPLPTPPDPSLPIDEALSKIRSAVEPFSPLAAIDLLKAVIAELEGIIDPETGR